MEPHGLWLYKLLCMMLHTDLQTICTAVLTEIRYPARTRVST